MNKVLYVDSKDEIILNDADIFILIRGKNCKTIKDYLNEVYKRLNIPSYNKYSLDAYIDWMTDKTFFKGSQIIFVIDNFDAFLKKDKKLKDEIVNIFKEDILPYWDKEVKDICVDGETKLFNVYLLKGEF